MRISEVGRQAGVPVATVKYYLREGLVPPGRATSPNQAQYDDTHVERVRLVRALTEVGGLGLATVSRVLAVIDRPEKSRLDVLATAQCALLGTEPADVEEAQAEPPATRARDWAQRRGWRVHPRDPVLDTLDSAWAACDTAGIGLDETRMDAYADAAERIAEVDVASVPAEPEAAARQVVLGTVLVDPVLTALRRLAQQHVAVSHSVAEDA